MGGEQRAKLIEWYMTHPEDHAGAAHAAKVPRSVAKKAWKGSGQLDRSSISYMYREHIAEARLKLALEHAELTKASILDTEAVAQALRDHLSNQRAQEGLMNGLNRMTAIEVNRVLQDMASTVLPFIASKVKKMVTDPDLSAPDAMHMLERLAKVMKDAADANRTIIQNDRLIAGEPTDTIVIKHEMTEDEVTRRLREFAEEIERVNKREVIDVTVKNPVLPSKGEK